MRKEQKMKKLISVILTLLILTSFLSIDGDAGSVESRSVESRIAQLETEVEELQNTVGNLESQVNFLSSQEFSDFILSQCPDCN